MLWLERRVVDALAGDDDRRTGGQISEFVATSLAAMPQHLRLGVVCESLALGFWTRLRHPGADAASIRRALTGFEHAPIGVIRQYPQLFNSLVLFAREELARP
jgi:hypothetical protein